jgi:hypothetical protein
MMKHYSKVPKIEAKILGLRCKERKKKESFVNENKKNSSCKVTLSTPLGQIIKIIQRTQIKKLRKKKNHYRN